jgi:hypothetical protein
LEAVFVEPFEDVLVKGAGTGHSCGGGRRYGVDGTIVNIE